MRDRLFASAKHAAITASKRHNRPVFVVYDPATIGVYGAYHVANGWDCDTYFNGAEVVFCSEE
jgi:hypothetical protein